MMSYPLTPNSNGRLMIAQEFLSTSHDSIRSLSSYFDLYESLCDFDLRQSVVGSNQAITSPDDIIRVVRIIKSNLNENRLEVQDRSCQTHLSLRNKSYAIGVCTQLMLMIDPSQWRGAERLSDCIMRTFPQESTLTLRDLKGIKHDIKAWKLRKRAYLTFIPTDYLHEHLLYDNRANTVKIFHHVAFLKAQLRRTSTVELDCGMEECLRMGTLPPRIFVETLDSLQSILFHASDMRSFDILEHLIDRGKFDQECRQNDGLIRWYDLPYDFEYRYWGARLAKLHLVVKNPQPRGPLQSWLRRHANDRNAFYIAMISLVLSAFFSFLGVIIGIIQTWLAWKALNTSS